MARKLIGVVLATAAVLVAAPVALAANFTFRAESLKTDLLHGLVDRQSITLDPAGPRVPVTGGDCAPDSVIGAVSQMAGGLTWDASMDSGTGAVTLNRFRNLPFGTPAVNQTLGTWVAYVGWTKQDDLCSPLRSDQAGQEILLYLKCGTQAASLNGNPCFGGEPIALRANGGGLAPLTPALTQDMIEVFVTRGSTAGPNAHVITDEGADVITDQTYLNGSANVPLTAPGPHIIVATESTGNVQHVPDRIPVCKTDGHDGFCGTTKLAQNPFDVNNYDNSCTTNGHDGFCGTTDTTGPPAKVTNITDKQVFKKKKGPGKVVGKIDPPDPNATKQVQLRLTRTWTTRVKVRVKPTKKKKSKAKKSAFAAKSKKKPKVKYRYRTVKHCQVWNDTTALLDSAKCGSKAAKGKYFFAEMGDLRLDFNYSFAMTLPTGSYTLEVVAMDELGNKDAPAPGRNVLTFKVL